MYYFDKRTSLRKIAPCGVSLNTNLTLLTWVKSATVKSVGEFVPPAELDAAFLWKTGHEKLSLLVSVRQASRLESVLYEKAGRRNAPGFLFDAW